MKVVIRSSSLLFTLFSIIFHAPIRRTAKPGTVEADQPRPTAETDPNPGPPSESVNQSPLVLRGVRDNFHS